MSDLANMYKSISDKSLLKHSLEIGNFTFVDLIQTKSDFDVNQVFTSIDLMDGDPNTLVYQKGLGILEDEDLGRLMDVLNVYEVITGKDDSYRFMRPEDSSMDLVKIKVNYANDDYGLQSTYFDFNTIEQADWEEVIDYDKIDQFFASANFLVEPGKEIEDPPHKFLWEDFDAVRNMLLQARERNESLFVYTLIEEDGEGYIDQGYLRINRMGYFLADKLIPMPELLRYW